MVFGMLVVVVGSVSGCAGDGPLTEREYRRAVNGVCRSATLATAKLAPPDVTQPDRRIAVGRRAVRIQQDSLRQLQKLDAPTANERRVGRWMNLVGRTIEQAHASLRAQEQVDLAAAARANAEGAVLRVRAEVIARELGVDDCTVSPPD